MILAAIAPSPRQVATGAYVLALIFAGTVLLIMQAVKEHGKPPLVGNHAWRAGWQDFILWFWFIFMAYLVGGIVIHEFLPSQPVVGHQSIDEDPNALIMRAAVMEIIILATQLTLILKAVRWSPAPVNSTPLGAGKILAAGALGWLTAYPIIMLTALFWRGLLVILRHWVPGLETPQQDPILLILKTHDPSMLVILFLVAVVLAPMNEELLFRAGFYRFCKAKIGRRAALVVVNLGFALAHGNVLNFLPLLVVGLLLTRVYERSGNIAVPITFHACFNLNTVVMLLLNPDLVKAVQSTL